VRREFSELPANVRERIERALGSRIAAAETQPSGFSPGIAARVRLENGERVFIKAVGPEPNPDSPGFHRRELEIVSSLPADAPVPRLLASIDEGEGGWVALAFEDVHGSHPVEPWRADELERVIEGAHELVAALTPSPIETPAAGPMLGDGINSWHLLRADPLPGLDAWSRRHLDALVALESEVVTAVEGETLLHLDIRADNVLLTDERVYFVDWPHAHVGVAWLDAVCFAPSVAMQGGADPDEVLARWPGGAVAAGDAVNAAVASIAGFFTHRALLPSPPGLPTLRAFQDAQGRVARDWLARRAGWN
jgi:aminoglycoside phosphotransferase (APT) family kinase protein